MSNSFIEAFDQLSILYESVGTDKIVEIDNFLTDKFESFKNIREHVNSIEQWYNIIPLRIIVGFPQVFTAPASCESIPVYFARTFKPSNKEFLYLTNGGQTAFPDARVRDRFTGNKSYENFVSELDINNCWLTYLFADNSAYLVNTDKAPQLPKDQNSQEYADYLQKLDLWRNERQAAKDMQQDKLLADLRDILGLSDNDCYCTRPCLGTIKKGTGRANTEVGLSVRVGNTDQKTLNMFCRPGSIRPLV